MYIHIIRITYMYSFKTFCPLHVTFESLELLENVNMEDDIKVKNYLTSPFLKISISI